MKRNRRLPPVYQLRYDDDGKLVAVNTRLADVVTTRYQDGTAVYWLKGVPTHACTARREDCHRDDYQFCRTQGHYREGEE